MKEFAAAVAQYVQADAGDILKHINNCRKRKLPRNQANQIIQRRGAVAKALAAMNTVEDSQ